MSLIWKYNPFSILDVGIGFGAMGTMFRQYTDIKRGDVDKWHTIIHGIEIHDDYRNPCWELYDEVFVGDALKVIPTLKRKYDIVFLGDVIEHLEKEKGKKLIDLCMGVAKRYVIITTPIVFAANKNMTKMFDNPHEEHKCVFRPKDFPEGAEVESFGRQYLVVIKV